MKYCLKKEYFAQLPTDISPNGVTDSTLKSVTELLSTGLKMTCRAQSKITASVIWHFSKGHS